MKKHKILYLLPLFYGMTISSIFGQSADSVGSYIQMKSEIRDSVVLLRWAPTDARSWSLLNRYGVRLERTTVVRDGNVLNEEPVMLIDTLKPEQSADFIQVAQTYSYGAVMAQAVFGETFELVGSGDYDVATLIAMGEDLQQRYVLSLYAADLCFPAARVAGWGWEDPNVRRNERYLYRVIPLVPEDEHVIEAGGLLVDTGREDRLPKPLDFRAEFGDGQARIVWNYRVLGPLYNAYVLERSIDSVDFSPVSDLPITEMGAASDGQITHVDSIGNGITYYYRLSGQTIFGSRGAYSDTVSGKGIRALKEPPLITLAAPDDNGDARIEWQFAEADQELIAGFTLERSDDDRQYAELIADIGKEQRTITVSGIGATNYYKIRANGLYGKTLASFPALVQAIDTIPPAVPQGLQAVVDSTGCVRLSWQSNTDPDIYGYRLFRGLTAEEELIPLNDVAIRETSFTDTLSMRLMNRKAYYAVTALDERYNQSARSSTIEALKPETIPPTAPLIREIEVQNGKNTIRWVSGGEPQIIGYAIYRRTETEEDFVLLASTTGAEALAYEDTAVENNVQYTYRVSSRTSGLTSEPSIPYPVTAISKEVSQRSGIDFTIVPRTERFVLQWENIPADVVGIQIYKKVGEGAFELFREVDRDSTGTDDDQIVPGAVYRYLFVVKTNGLAPVSIVKEVRL